MRCSWQGVVRVVGAATVCLGLVAGARADLVNPSFEQPDVAAGDFQNFFAGETIGSGWVVESGIPAVLGDGVLGLTATDGDQMLYVDNSLLESSLYQDVALAAGTGYRLAFDLSTFDNDANTLGAVLTVDISLGGSSILAAPATFTRPLGSAGFVAQSLDFTTAAGGTYRIRLGAPTGSGTVVDNFSLTPLAVPEPGSVALTGIGLAGMAIIAWRRRK